MVVVSIIFAISGLMIAISIVYAAVNLIKADRTLKRSQHTHLRQKTTTLIDISTISTNCKCTKNADTNNGLEERIKEIEQTIKADY